MVDGVLLDFQGQPIDHFHSCEPEIVGSENGPFGFGVIEPSSPFAASGRTSYDVSRVDQISIFAQVSRSLERVVVCWEDPLVVVFVGVDLEVDSVVVEEVFQFVQLVFVARSDLAVFLAVCRDETAAVHGSVA